MDEQDRINQDFPHGEITALAKTIFERTAERDAALQRAANAEHEVRLLKADLKQQREWTDQARAQAIHYRLLAKALGADEGGGGVPSLLNHCHCSSLKSPASSYVAP